MFRYTSIKINGAGGRPLSNLLLKQEGQAGSLALLFPGLNYSCDMPLLYYPARMLAARGADVLMLDTAYGRSSEFAALDAAGKLEWVRADAQAALDAALGLHSYTRITLVGKSIGTRALAELAADPRLKQARMVWLTPLLNDARLVEQIRMGGQCGLFVAGGADSFYLPDVLQELAGSTCGRTLVLAGADHSLEVAGQFWVGLRYLTELLETLEQFLDQ